VRRRGEWQDGPHDGFAPRRAGRGGAAALALAVAARALGEVGLALARREPPALVVADPMMPEVDGAAVVEGLRADPATGATSVVVRTATTMTAGDEARPGGRTSVLVQKGGWRRGAFVELGQRPCPAASGGR
jgi:CheY-like chemotaxis protein